jgi:hypothetical protein
VQIEPSRKDLAPRARIPLESRGLPVFLGPDFFGLVLDSVDDLT